MKRLLLLLLILIVTFSCTPTSTEYKAVINDNIKLETILIKWVYTHSERISLQTTTIIVKEAIKTNKPLLILALMEMESNFTPTAVSSKGAVGLTQIMFEIHGKALIKKGIIKEKRDLFDIAPSVQAGNLILDDLLIQSKGDVSKALERYLGGRDGAYLHRILSNLANLYILIMVK